LIRAILLFQILLLRVAIHFFAFLPAHIEVPRVIMSAAALLPPPMIAITRRYTVACFAILRHRFSFAITLLPAMFSCDFTSPLLQWFHHQLSRAAC